MRQRVVNNIALPAATLLSAGQLERLQSILDDYLQQRSTWSRSASSKGRSPADLDAWTRATLACGRDRRRRPDLRDRAAEHGQRQLGRVELRFADPPTGILAAINRNPGFVLLAMVICLGTLTYWLYMRRVLQEFDPARGDSGPGPRGLRCDDRGRGGARPQGAHRAREQSLPATARPRTRT
ncbi:MAG: hypothetical protein R3E48_21695 [Burkholderiaceae bacterium]